MHREAGSQQLRLSCSKDWHANWQPAVQSGTYSTSTSIPGSASSTNAYESPRYSPPIQLQSSFTGSSQTHRWQIVEVMPALQQFTWVSSGLLPADSAERVHFSRCCCASLAHMSKEKEKVLHTRQRTWVGPGLLPAPSPATPHWYWVVLWAQLPKRSHWISCSHIASGLGCP